MTFDATAIALVVGALAAGVVLIINAIGSNQRETAKALAELATKTAVIEGHVNGAATRQSAIIAAQETQLAMLREQISKLETAAAVLIQVAPKVES